MNVSFALDDHNQLSPYLNHQQDAGNTINSAFVSSATAAAVSASATTPTVPSKRKRASTSSTSARTQHPNFNGANGTISSPSPSQNSGSIPAKAALLSQDFSSSARSTSTAFHPPHIHRTPQPSGASTLSALTATSTSSTGTNSSGPAAGQGSDSISCICGFVFDDGFSIACDECGRWSHARCYEISQANVPDDFCCLECRPRDVDRDRAIRLQKVRKKEIEAEKAAAILNAAAAAAVGEINGGGGASGGGGVNGINGVGHQGSGGATGTGPPAKRGRGRRGSVGTSVAGPSSQSSNVAAPPLASSSSDQAAMNNTEDEHVDIEEEWRSSFVPLATDSIPMKTTRDRLRAHAQSWRGVVALAPSASSSSSSPEEGEENVYEKPKTKVTTVPPGALDEDEESVSVRVRPPSYALHTTTPIQGEQLVAPFTSTVIPSSTYLSNPLNEYAHIGMPMPFVHLIPPPLSVALDARLTGSEARFARSGCKPNAVLRPVLCRRGDKGKGKTKESTTDLERSQRATESPEVGYDPTMPPPQFPASNGVNGISSNNHKSPSPSSVSPGPSSTSSSSTAQAETHKEREEEEERLSFGIFALRDLKASEEVVLGWEWDDGSVVHELPALVEALAFGGAGPSKMTPHHRERLRLQMQNVVHSLQSSFVACACGKNAKDCAVRWMERFVDGGANGVRHDGYGDVGADLGPLIGKKRGVRTRIRGGLATGGIRGVELVDEDGNVYVDDDDEGSTTGHRASSKRRSAGPGPPRLLARKGLDGADNGGDGDTAPPPKMRGRGRGAVGVVPEDSSEGDGIAGFRIDMDSAMVGSVEKGRSREPERIGVLGAPFTLSSKPSPTPIVPSSHPPPIPVAPTRARTSSSIFSLLNADPVSPISSSHPRPSPFSSGIPPPQPPASAPPVVSEAPSLHAPLAERSSPQFNPVATPSPAHSPYTPTREHLVSPRVDKSIEVPPWAGFTLGEKEDSGTGATTPEQRHRRSASHSSMSDVQREADRRQSGRSASPPASPPTNALQLSTVPDEADADVMEVDVGVAGDATGDAQARTPSPPYSPPSTPSSPPPFVRAEVTFEPEQGHGLSRSPSPVTVLSTRSPSPSLTSAPVLGEDEVVKAVEESPASPSIRSTDSAELEVEVGQTEDRSEDVHEPSDGDDKEETHVPYNDSVAKEGEKANGVQSLPLPVDGTIEEQNVPLALPTIEEPVEPAPSEGTLGLAVETPHRDEKSQEPESEPGAENHAAQEAPKVKLSMADYLKRKKKQREEATAKSVGGTAPTTPSVEASAELHGGPPTVESEPSVPTTTLTIPSEPEAGVVLATAASPSVKKDELDPAEVDESKRGVSEEKAAEKATEDQIDAAQPKIDTSQTSPVETRKDSATTDELLARFYNTSLASTAAPIPTPVTPVLDPPLFLKTHTEPPKVAPSEESIERSTPASERRGSVVSTQSQSAIQDDPPSTVEVKQEQLATFVPPYGPSASPPWEHSNPIDWSKATFSSTPPRQNSMSWQAQEDGEIFSTPSTPAPRSPVTARAYARKDIFTSAAPPTQPRSFRHSPPPPPGSSRDSHSRDSRSPPRSNNHRSYRPRDRSPPPKGGSGAYVSPYRDPRAIPANPRIPSGPRALRDPHSSSRDIPSGVANAALRRTTFERDRDRDRARPPGGEVIGSSRRPFYPNYDRDRGRDIRDRDRDWDRDRDRRLSGAGPPSSTPRSGGGRS